MEAANVTKRVIWENEDGQLVYLIPAPKSKLSFTQIIEKDVPIDPRTGKQFKYEIIDRTELPKSREYRDAWKKKGRKIGIDMPKAREIHMDRIRLCREKAFKELDDNIRLLEDMGQPTTDQRKKRQELRDIPQKFDLSTATTPEELSTLWPTEIPDLRNAT